MQPAELRSRGLLESLDVELARALVRASGKPQPDVELAIALTSRHVRRGHTCFFLGTRADELWPHETFRGAVLPERLRWEESLRASALTRQGPLVLDDEGRLYLRRYWALENDIARTLRAEWTGAASYVDPSWSKGALERLFPAESDPLRRQAAVRALQHRVSLLCGGPGTGKTTTVARIVALLVERELRQTQAPPRVLLLAPTGKAAARLGDAVRSAKSAIDAPDEVLDCISTDASTVHRALGMHREGMRFRKNAGSPLEARIVVLDEASMIDLALMRQLLDATPPDATLLVVGDPDQLTSVEAGSVLRDLVDANEQTWWKNRATHLTKTWRYDETSSLGRIVRAIRQGDGPALDALLSAEDSDAVSWAPLSALPSELDRAAELWAQTLRTRDSSVHFELRSRYVMLTPFRRGPIGTLRLGALMKERLRAAGVEPPVTPIIIEQNSEELRAYNGDFAMWVPDENAAYLETESERDRAIAASRLPRFSDAYALSVHKSQGSEFDEVLLLLPEEDAPLLTRELLYTAVSRARKRVRIVGPKEVVAAALARRARRDSGLVDAIARARAEAPRDTK